MAGDVFGVRIIPPVLQFFNTVPHTLFKLPITVMNISKTSKNIRYYGPKSENFSVKVKNPEEPVAPGLCVTAIVEYCPMNEKEEKDRIVLTVDGNVIEVPIFAYPCQPMLELTEVANFGTLVANSKPSVKEIILTNTGSKKGDFNITYKGSKHITIIPCSGTLSPHCEQKIKVEYVASVEGKFQEVAEVFLEGQENTSLLIKGSVIERALEILSTNEDNSHVECVRFGSTYYGTDKLDCAVLYNNGPDSVNFVAVIDENAIAQEMGVDLTKSISAALADEGEDGKRGHINEVTSLIAVIPNQGVLVPYQKIPIYFRFSPRWYSSQRGWKTQSCPAPRKDFALFVKLQAVGSSNGYVDSCKAGTHKGKRNVLDGMYAEVALTGTALPVLLNIAPTAKLDFGECPVGEHADILCTVKNESNILPTQFEFRRTAHFTAYPSAGKILPGQTQDVIFSFAPKQIGTFKPEQFLDVLGQITDRMNPLISMTQVIHSLPIKLSGCSNPITTMPKAKFNPGITPYITNEVGMFVDTSFKDLKDVNLRNAVAGCTKTKFHQLKSLRSATYEDKYLAKVAFPNDRACSVRPSNPKERYKSLFTRSDRYNYIDPDYAFDDLEIEKRLKHRLGYVQLIHASRMKRLEKKQAKEIKKITNRRDIGIKSAAGIFPKKLTQAEIFEDTFSELPPNTEWKILSTKELAQSEKQVISKPICDGLHAVPTTAAEKKDCVKWLSPQELHQVVVGPPAVEFGQVCMRSVCQKELKIINNLSQFIHIVAEIDCVELRQSSPLSQVVPPQCKAVIPIIFESNTKGTFQRSIVYTINGFYKHHIIVLAEVVPVALELSTGKICLRPSSGMPVEAGFRGVITLYNKLNYPAEFSWSPDLGEKGTAFSIRPASGVVDANTDLDCEVVWHASFMAPDEGSFTLFISGGESRKLCCSAEVGNTNMFFIDQRINFGAAPVNLTTAISSLLHNSGSNHGYFYVIDPNPLPNLIVSPVTGVVPVGGSTEIHVALTPDSIMKFDTKIMVAIKGGKTLELRVAGSVESPNINILVSSFNFGGVYCGSSATIPFELENKANSKCRFEVDLTKYQDFSITFPGCQTQDDFNFQLLNPGKASVTLDPEEVIEGEITFTPKQVAAYDFILPVTVNYLQDRGPMQPQITPSSSSNISTQHLVNPKPTPPIVTVSRKLVIGTAMRQPLQLQTNRLEFILPPDFHEKSSSVKAGVTKNFSITNISSERLTWGLDLRVAGELLSKGIFKIINQDLTLTSSNGNKYVEGQLDPGQHCTVHFNFCPVSSRRYQTVIPVAINSSWDKPFQFLELVGEMKAPTVWFEPANIVLTPVPLLTETCAEFTMFAVHFDKSTKMSVSTPHIECEDESKISPLSVKFLEGDVIKPVRNAAIQLDPSVLLCKVTFSSSKPISFSRPLIFFDEKGNKFPVQVTATADNCLLTCYPFLAQHRCDHKIICEQGTLPKGSKPVNRKPGDGESVKSGEAILVACESPSQTGRSTSATTSSFEPSSSSYENSTTATEPGSCAPCPGAREGAKNKSPTCSDYARCKTGSVGSAIFPAGDSEEAVFFMKVLMTVQRWFSYQGWPGGPYPIVIPETLRTAISKKSATETLKHAEEPSSKTQVRGKAKSKGGYHRLVKTIYDMITFLSGKALPGIPASVSLPTNPVDRVRQIYWQHCTLLTFLRCQGACVASILPEYLMAPADFVLWRQLQRSVKLELLQKGNLEDAEKIQLSEDIGEEVFEAISRRMWTDIMLQILKVLVLSKVTPKTLKALSMPDKDIIMPTVNPNPLSSNIYSVSERILLAWMNYHYETHRHIIWENCPKGGLPPSRWIVNFDYDLLDGLVLAALLGSHMPFLIKTHLKGMYTSPATAEQCLHNALKVICAMKYVGIDYDIHAIDITDPNPISMLLFVVHLYERLPQYLPKATVDFVGSLHSVIARQVKVSNTSAKSLVYNVLLAGRDACDFLVPKGSVVTVPSKSHLLLTVEFRSRFLRSAEAVLALVGKRQGSTIGNTMIFKLVTEIDTIKPKSTVKVECPCYELEQITLEVRNPFPEGGNFHILLIEYRLPTNETANQPAQTKEKKKTSSKTNLLKKKTDSQTDVIPMNRILEHKESMTVKNSQIPTLLAFHTSMRSIHLDSFDAGEVRIDFLPFHVGDRQCSVVLLNENIGEFLYSIDAKALDPLPSYLPYTPNKNSVRISSDAVTGTARAKDINTIYWRCEAGCMLKESLLIPMTNAAKERALITIAQQQMDTVEMQRRQITGTLMSCSVIAKTMKSLSNNPAAAIALAKAMGPVADVYRVEVDSEFFQVPDMLVMPNFQDITNKCMPKDSKIRRDINLADGVAELVVQFKAKEPGPYQATIKLTAIDDVRIYRIECTVTPQGSATELEFHTPVYQSVTQDIPIVNMSDVDWPIVATITGNGFRGPETLLARAHVITNYPLTFKPVTEEEVVGKLILANRSDDSEQVVELIGKGEKPLPLDHIQLTCGARASLHHTVKVPNVTRKRLTYRVESDLPFISGEQTITVLPHQTGSYNMVITPNRRGQFHGILAFIAGRCRVNEIDSDDEAVLEEDSDSEFHGFRMWYSLEVDVKPPLPEKTVTVVCNCYNKTVVDFIVRNPTPKEINLKASIRGSDLTGPLSITLAPGVKDVYSLTFAPTQAGESRGSLIFFHEDVGEFWYNLVLKAEPPAQKTLPNMECELGSWTRQMITLNNPTDEGIDVYPSVSNTNNFTLEIDTERPILLKPGSATKVSLKFKPSNLGDEGHTAKVVFSSAKLGEWVFYASGTGLLPTPHLPVVATATPGSSTSLFIVFRNPTDVAILTDVSIVDNDQDYGSPTETQPSLESPFKLLLKHSSGIRVGPKSSLEIPVSFAPSECVNYQAYCWVVMRREDGQNWSFAPKDALGNLALPASVSEIRWLYPLHGMTDQSPAKDVYRFSTSVHNQMGKNVEIALKDSHSKTNPATARVKTPKQRKSLTIAETSIVGHTPETAEEYTFELLYDDDETKNLIESFVDMKIIKHMKTQSTGIVSLVFDVNFSPTITMDHLVNLLIKKAEGGFWLFPLRFTATEPPVDDTIVIESSGLDKPSSIGFRLNSQQQCPEDFYAFFENGSDPAFSVTPEKGVLAPKDKIGTLVTVTFLPKMYGKMYSSKLIVKTSSNVQWTYAIKGVLPEYQPPRGVSAPPIAGPHLEVRAHSTKKNHVRRNMTLLTTSVSSPIKGAHLVPITKGYNQAVV
ncbi:hypothetical protein BsWGS_12463 [Bradybaena similaris]